MWDKPITFRQAAWLAGAVSLGGVGISYQMGHAIQSNLCLEQQVNTTLANINLEKTQTLPGEVLEKYKVPKC